MAQETRDHSCDGGDRRSDHDVGGVCGSHALGMC